MLMRQALRAGRRQFNTLARPAFSATKRTLGSSVRFNSTTAGGQDHAGSQLFASFAGYGGLGLLGLAINNLFVSDPPEPAQASHTPAHDEKKVELPQVVFVLGGPGAGKGTQCGNIVRDFGFVHLSAGDLLRAERKTGSANAELINNYIKQGAIVPVEITISLIKAAMDEHMAKGRSKFLIDGFPRNENNDDGWRGLMEGQCDVKFVLFFDCPETVMEARLLERGKTSGRADDNAASIKKRFRTYLDSTMPIIERYGAMGKVQKVMADDSRDVVYSRVKGIFTQHF